jgi:nucleoside-diphosphate-sugar epimerase
MKVFLTGGTGAVGPATVAALLAAGHEVRAVARDDPKADRLRRSGAEPVTVDLFDREALRAATGGCDAIAHLATNVPPLSKAVRRDAWATHNRLRTETTRHLLAAAGEHGITTFVKESVVFVYPDRAGEWIDESVPPDRRVRLLEPTLDGEAAVTTFTDAGGRGIVLRFGLFYSATSRVVDESLRLARVRGSMLAGPAGSYQSSIHTDDAARAVVLALEAPPGTYNVCDDEPLTRRDYLDAFSSAFHLPRLYPTPGWLVRLLAGPSADALLGSGRVANHRFRTATGWAPDYPSVRAGWAAVAAARAEQVAAR